MIEALRMLLRPHWRPRDFLVSRRTPISAIRRCISRKSASKIRKPATRVVRSVEAQADSALSELTQASEGKFKYPENLLVYLPATSKTTLVAFIKANTIVFFGGGSLYFGWNTLADDSISNWRVLPVIAYCAIPWAVVSYITAPYVASVSLRLPVHARVSQAHLEKFVRKMPPDTRLTFATIRILPHRGKFNTVTWQGLHKLSPRLGRLANLEYRPSQMERSLTQVSSGRSALDKIQTQVSATRTRFYVPRSKGAETGSRVPGIWELMWEELGKKPR